MAIKEGSDFAPKVIEADEEQETSGPAAEHDAVEADQELEVVNAGEEHDAVEPGQELETVDLSDEKSTADISQDSEHIPADHLVNLEEDGAEEKGELDLFWEEAVVDNSENDNEKSGISYEEALRLGLVPGEVELPEDDLKE